MRTGEFWEGRSSFASPVHSLVLEEVKFKVNIVLREGTVAESVKTEEDSEEQLNVPFSNGGR